MMDMFVFLKHLMVGRRGVAKTKCLWSPYKCIGGHHQHCQFLSAASLSVPYEGKGWRQGLWDLQRKGLVPSMLATRGIWP